MLLVLYYLGQNNMGTIALGAVHIHSTQREKQLKAKTGIEKKNQKHSVHACGGTMSRLGSFAKTSASEVNGYEELRTLKKGTGFPFSDTSCVNIRRECLWTFVCECSVGN